MNQGARPTPQLANNPIGARVPILWGLPPTRQGNPRRRWAQTSRPLPATAVLAVVVVVAVALVVVPFLVPVTNSIWGGRGQRVRPGQSRWPHLLASHLPEGDRSSRDRSSAAAHKGGIQSQLCRGSLRREVLERRLQGIFTALKKAARTDTTDTGCLLPSPGFCRHPGPLPASTGHGQEREGECNRG